MTFILTVYLLLSLGVAFYAYLKTYDAIEYFFLSVLTTPFAAFYFLMKTDKLR
ncbi:MAG: hypothetical protein GY816_01740 [Cytophagales bacterium]|nr:hypothetical protein [Cytophagales bacterium]